MGLQSEVMFLNDSLENHTKRVGQEAVFDCKVIRMNGVGPNVVRIGVRLPFSSPNPDLDSFYDPRNYFESRKLHNFDLFSSNSCSIII